MWLNYILSACACASEILQAVDTQWLSFNHQNEFPNSDPGSCQCFCFFTTVISDTVFRRFLLPTVLWNSWIQLRLRNESFEQISLNESISSAGHGFCTWQRETRHTYMRKVMPRPTHEVKLSKIKKNETWWPSITMLTSLTSRLVYIYSIKCM
jgi:hypothetical protein